MKPEPESAKVRLDKWLWAARFYKTRSLAAQAVDGGRVYYDGQRAKASKEVHAGAMLRINKPDGEWEVEVLGVSAHRGGAPEAALLYAETEDSRKRREQAALGRRAGFGLRERGEGRPTKRQRRQIKRFTENW